MGMKVGCAMYWARQPINQFRSGCTQYPSLLSFNFFLCWTAKINTLIALLYTWRLVLVCSYIFWPTQDFLKCKWVRCVMYTRPRFMPSHSKDDGTRIKWLYQRPHCKKGLNQCGEAPFAILQLKNNCRISFFIKCCSSPFKSNFCQAQAMFLRSICCVLWMHACIRYKCVWLS